MGESSIRRSRRASVSLCLAGVLILCGCVSQETRRDAVEEINREFRAENEAVLARKGTRIVAVTSGEALDATHATLVKLGMSVRQQSRGLGLVTADAPAPLPLSRDEWNRAAMADLPKARSLLSRHVGYLANFFTFEPEGLLIVINATVLEAGQGTEIAFTMRMREIEAPKSGMPRREYPPPTAVEIGLDKLWAALDRELKERSRTNPRR